MRSSVPGKWRTVVAGLCFVTALFCYGSTTSFAVEGSTAAGPLGGTDMRSAQLPPPGLYGVVVGAFAEADHFFDGKGNRVAALDSLYLKTELAAAAFLYVPKFQVLGGSLGLLGVVTGGQKCGRIFAATNQRCIAGFGDPYVELDWSRFFGTVRPSRYPGAFPIAEGLTVQLGIGAVIPIGRYSAADARTHGLAVGNNIWDIAPTAAFTYMTPPILAEGTEFSAKFYWNNYLTNPDTNYKAGDLLSLDFALTERVGRFQFGLAGFYADQVEDDKIFGVKVPPDGRRARALSLGFVGAYDMPEFGASIKVKGLWQTIKQNTPDSYGLSIAYAKKLY